MKSNSYPFSGILVRLDKTVKSSPEQGESSPEQDDLSSKQGKVSLQPNPPRNELHVNLWDFDTQAVLDIGIMIHTDEEFQNIVIDVPWQLERADIFDIASGIDSEKFLCAIFNRKVNYTSDTAGCPIISFPEESAKNFYLIRLNGSAYEVEYPQLQAANTITRIKIENPKNIYPSMKAVCGRYYLRFRLLGVPKEAFSTSFTQRDRNLLSSCTQAKVIDFRINTTRGIPDEVLSPVRTNFVFPKFDQIHLFLIIHREREFTLQGQTFKACRSLEDESVWNGYIRLDEGAREHHAEVVSDYLGYQWTEKSSNDGAIMELVALAKFTRVISGGWIRLRFVLIAVLLGACSSGLWDHVYNNWIYTVFNADRPPVLSVDTRPFLLRYTHAVALGTLVSIAVVIYKIPEESITKLCKLLIGVRKWACGKNC